MNTPVSFEISKLLKEKGFDLNHKYMFFTSDETEKYPEEELSLKPTIAEVVMWLYKKHEIWVWVERYSTLFRPYSEEIGDKRFGKWEGHKYSTPTEAYEAAIIYTLKNLI